MTKKAVELVNPYSDGRSKESQVESMFDNIAPAYDFMNRAMTFGLDRMWLGRLLRVVQAEKPSHIADFATGTGDVAIAMARRMPQARLTGLDLSEGMLARAKQKTAGTPLQTRIRFRQADCLATPLDSGTVDVVTVAYGVRNYADISAGIAEIYRVLRPGGLVAVLELSVPANPVAKALYKVYTRMAIPLAGRIVAGDGAAYRYLLDSIASVPQRDDMCRIFEENGFVDARWHSLTLGACTLYVARKN